MSQHDTLTLEPCPFCGRHVEHVSRADNHSATGKTYIVSCFCGGYSACAHQQEDTPEEVVAAWNRRATLSATQPAQAAQSEPVRHVGDSKFKSWYQAHPKANGGDKQLARDAYAAGMSDPVAQGAGEAVAELKRLASVCPELNLNNYGPDDVDELNAWAVEVAQAIDQLSDTQPAAGADVLKNAARYEWLRAQDNEDFAFAVVKNPHFDVYESPEELDAAIDAALTAHEQKAGE